MADWNNPNPINTNPGGDTKYQGFVKAQANFDDIYSKLNVLKKLQTGVNPPDNPAVGELWFDENTGIIKRFDGTDWVEIVAKQDLSNVADSLILDKIKNVDGVGSGLDADLIRGLTVEQTMSRTFYVDAISGSDDNDGSENTPFKTLKKAINSIPVGGMGHIYLISDINLDENILIDNKAINLTLNKHILNIQSFNDDIHNYYFGFNLRKSSISIESGEINLSGKANANLSWQYGALGAVFKGEHPAGVNFVRIGFATLNMPSDAGALCASGVGNWAIITHLLFELVKIKRDGGFIYNIQNGTGVGSLTVHETSLQNGAGHHLSWTNVILGIIRDAKGTPRNIISNIVL